MTGLGAYALRHRTPAVWADADWALSAACRGLDPELWFPIIVHGDRALRRTVKEKTRMAQRICNECPVKNQCLEYALTTDTRYGIWGGATENDRAHLKGRRRTL